MTTLANMVDEFDMFRQGRKRRWPRWTEMEKAYKIARAQLGAWKICTQNMCEKCSKPFKSEKKMPKIAQKRQTTLKNAGKKQKLAHL